MAVLNLYRSASAYTTVTITELGAIDEWDQSQPGINDNNLGGIVGGLDIMKFRRTGSMGAGNPLNAIDFEGASSIQLYANDTLNMNIYMDTLWATGYKQIIMKDYNPQSIYGRFEVSNDPYTNVINKVYLARATIGNQTYIGFYVYNMRENAGQLGQNGFYTNSEWSEAFLREAYFINTDNPYWGGGYATSGGGEPSKQNWTERSDFVNPDSMPDETAVGALASGLISIFIPTIDQVQRLADVLWQNDFLSFMDSQFSNIEDLIISFGMVPFTVPAGGSGTYTWFNYAVLVPGATFRYASFRKPANQFVEINLGNVSLTGGDTSDGFSTDSVLDYAPYSKLGIYLPFIGYEELNIDECRGNTINLTYRIDILSGACLALISINGRTLYQFTGNCLVQLPVTSQDCSQMIANTVNVGIAAASAGAAGAIASAGTELASDRLMASEGSAMDIGQYNLTVAQHAGRVSSATGSLIGASANAAMGMKPNYKMTGAISGSTTLVGVKQPYLFLTTPRQSMPDGYERVCGFPCNIGGKLGDFSGYTVVEDVRLNGLVATSPEVEEIYQLLKSGIII